MIAVGHTSVGTMIGVAAVAAFSPNIPCWAQILAVLLVGIVSHYACDWVPHGHYYIDPKRPKLKQIVIFLIDVAGGIIVFGGIALAKFGIGFYFALIAAGIVGALAPDLLDGLVNVGIVPKTKLIAREMAFHLRMHWHNDHQHGLPPDGARRLAWIDVWQVGEFITALAVLIRV